MDYYSYLDSTAQVSRSVNGISAFFAAIGAYIGLIFTLGTVLLILQIVAMWKIFSKAGEEGWKSIVPIYNMVILFKISGINPWLILVYLATPIPVVGVIALIALNIYLAINLSKAFGKDTAFVILLVLLPFIGYLVLGLSKDAQYVGNGQTGFQNGSMNPNQGYNPMGQNGPMNPNQGYNPMGQNGPMNPNQGYNPMGQNGPVNPNQGYEPMGQNTPVNPNQGYEPMQPTNPTNPNQPNPPTGMPQ